jgi:hypothetical protein
VTFFMLQVSDTVSGRAGTAEPPAVQPSRRRSVGHGAHEMVELRSLAEQLVCEANAVLGGTGRELTLEDEVGQEQLAFTLRSGPTWARVVTSFAQRRSWGQLVTPDAVGEAFELTGADALPDLILALVSADGDTVALRATPRPGTVPPLS